MKYVLGIPTGRAQLSMHAANTALTLQAMILRRGGDFVTEFVAHAEVVKARNVMMARFLEGGGDVFVGMDDDMAIRADVLSRLLDLDADMAGVLAPPRTLPLREFHGHAAAGLPYREALRATSPLIGPPVETDGIVEVSHVGCGFFLLRRSALEQVIAAGLAPLRETWVGNGWQSYHAFFDPIANRDGRQLSEDFSFCYRLRKAGLRILAYRGEGVGHVGEMVFWS